MELLKICKDAKKIAGKIGNLGTDARNQALTAVADALVKHSDEIIAANEKDLENGRKSHMPEGLLDRLMLNVSRIEQIAEGLRQIAALDDPIGEVIFEKKRPNGLSIAKKRVPIGVVGMIYEARPNVTVDAFGLCFKTGNVVILKGGSDAVYSNMAIISVIQETLLTLKLPREAVQLLEDNSRETAAQFMKMNEYVDVLIPRGGAGLIKAVVRQATVPVIETGTGNCHIYVDESADFTMAVNIIINAKTQRIGVCNACESLLIHESIVAEFIPVLTRALQDKDVTMYADEEIRKSAEAVGGKKELILPASEEDWGKEYLDYILSAKSVSSVQEAIAHINCYNTGHSEAIITNNYQNAEQFLNEVDAACVYVNASTRFSDGFEFGFGAEIGISTQKLHARGPMGLEALTSTKYVIRGNGQVR